MTTSSVLGFDPSIAFPDNGIISQAYDQRVSQNDMLYAGMKLMHQQSAYVREENLLGAGIYTWEPDFIALIDKSMADGIKANFSQDQGRLFSQYMLYLTNGLVANTPEAVLALDSYLGSR